jgi:SAM-dependent methyltransferase/aryl carrier-like protein
MQAEQAPLDLDLGSYAAKWRVLDRLSTAYMVRTLRQLGAFGVDGEASSVDDLVQAHGIAPSYRHLLARWLRHLVGEGFLREEENGSFIAPGALPPAGDAEALAAARVALRDIPPILEYIERCGARLDAFLTGKASPLETLFPDGTFDTATALYQDWAVSRYVSAIARAVLGATVEAAPGRGLRVLEVGAGTGGTAAALVPRLAPDRGTYWYTDVSTAFIARAREKLAAYPFVRYAVLDVERDPSEQGFQGGAFDVIVATNVVHATRDVEATLRRLRSLLAPGGVLILGEATTHLAWFDVTTGLIEGWQRFEDASRGDSPLLPPAAWDRALRAAGFDAVACLPESGSAAAVLGQHVLVARVQASAAAGDVRADVPSEMVAAEPEPSAPVVPVGDMARRLAEARPADRHALALEYVTLQVAAVLRVSRAETLDPRQRLMDLGLDSLMALELRGRLALGLGLAGGLPATLVFEHPTIDAVARYLVREAMGTSEPSPDARRHEPAAPSTDEAAARIAHLSEEEVAALLVKKLESL